MMHRKTIQRYVDAAEYQLELLSQTPAQLPSIANVLATKCRQIIELGNLLIERKPNAKSKKKNHEAQN